MLFSLAIHNDEPINVWFLYHGLELNDRQQFCSYLKDKCNVNVTFVEVDDSLFRTIKIPIYIKHISIETYYRLIAQFILPKDLDRIMWIDSDIIVKNNIKEFYNQDLGNYAMAACTNMGEGKGNQSNKVRLELKKDSIYFNAGVLLFNLKYLRGNTNMDAIFKFCSDNIEKIRLQDQDILNMMFEEKVKVWTDQLYNCIANSPQDFITPDICERCAIIHFAGWQKPWKFKWQDNCSKYYWNIKQKETSLNFKELFIKNLGYIWFKIKGNKILSYICSPYYWAMARLKTEKG